VFDVAMPLSHIQRYIRSRSAASLARKLDSFIFSPICSSSSTAWKVTTAVVISIAHCGDGKASTTDRVRVAFWLTTDPPGEPRHAMLKAILLPSWLRIGGRLMMQLTGMIANALHPVGLDSLVFLLINCYNYYLPHAPDAMYENEAKVYRFLRPEFDELELLEAPRVFATQMDPKARQWAVLLEDLSLRSARFPTALEELSLRELHWLIGGLAQLHSTYWQSERFATDLAWVPTIRRGGVADVFETIGFGLARDHVKRHAFERELLSPLALSIEELWLGLTRANEMLETEPLTLCHGDCHVQNTFILDAEGKAGFYDWQLCLRACWARDVSYLIATSLDTEQRRRHEEKLLSFYLGRLREAGVVVAAETARSQYAQAMAWGLVIGWLLCPPQNYGEAVLSANVRRLVAACKDLGTFGALGVHRS
jgi:hypothetical protein